MCPGAANTKRMPNIRNGAFRVCVSAEGGSLPKTGQTWSGAAPHEIIITHIIKSTRAHTKALSTV